MGEVRITDELAAKFGIEHSANTIRRSMVPRLSGRGVDEARRPDSLARGGSRCDTLRRDHASKILPVNGGTV